MSEFQKMIAELADTVAAKAAIKTVERMLAERPMLHRYLSTKQVSIYLGVSIDALQLCRGQERGPKYIRMNRSIRYDIHWLDSWMAGLVPGIDGTFVTGPSCDREGQEVKQ
jgi:hypothetical protein